MPGKGARRRRRTRVHLAQSREQASPDIPEEEYLLGKVSVWWDIENCHVPKDMISTSQKNSISCNIMQALKNLGHRGEISIHVYGNCDEFSPKLQRAMTSNGVRFVHVPPGEDAADKRMMVDMVLWGLENPAPATYLIMSGDSDFSYVQNTLTMEKYKVMMAHPDNVRIDFPPPGTTVLDLYSLLSGGLPKE